MPGAADKIIINSFDTEADTFSALKALEAGKHISEEIESKGFLKEAQAFLPRQEALCKKLEEALQGFVADQRALNNEMRKWLDDQLGLNAP